MIQAILQRLFGQAAKTTDSGAPSPDNAKDPPRSNPDEKEPLSTIHEETLEGYKVRIDLSSQVLLLDVDPDIGGFQNVLYPTLVSMTGGTRSGRRQQQLFTSASLLGQKAKQFDDGFVAAIALAIQHGLPRIASKPSLVKELAHELTQQAPQAVESVLPLLLAAGELGGGSDPVPETWQAKVDAVLGDFFSDSLRSKPLGVYTWTPELTDLFRQDRILQTKLPPQETSVVASVLRERRELLDNYTKLLTVMERLTNRYSAPDFRRYADSESAEVESAALFPFCTSPETELLQRMFPFPAAVPAAFSLIEEVIRRIRSGELSLRPNTDSGWYVHQLWSLEPLIVPDQTPEAEHLRMNPNYRDHLANLFKSLFALTRETHVKDLEVRNIGAAGGLHKDPTLYLRPSLTVEPLATLYRRRALAYRFIHESLVELIGEDDLMRLNRLTENGSVKMRLAEELRDMEALFWGAYLVSMHELGLPATFAPGSTGSSKLDESFCRKNFKTWQLHALEDEDIAQDSRMMVPVFYDLGRKQIKVWVFLGWKETWIKVSFYKEPTVNVRDASGKECTRPIKFRSTLYSAAQPVMAEVYVNDLMDRSQFRDHCDRYKTAAAILENLV